MMQNARDLALLNTGKQLFVNLYANQLSQYSTSHCHGKQYVAGFTNTSTPVGTVSLNQSFEGFVKKLPWFPRLWMSQLLWLLQAKTLPINLLTREQTFPFIPSIRQPPHSMLDVFLRRVVGFQFLAQTHVLTQSETSPLKLVNVFGIFTWHPY
jgi:hypothetical protein